MRPLRTLPFLTAAFLLFSAAQAAALEVVVSIKPLHSIAAFVMEGAGAPSLLLKGPVSEHVYALKPSDARMLEKAQLILWTGRELETYLVKPLSSLRGGARQIAALDIEGMELLKARSGADWAEAHDHGAGQRGPHSRDAHFWFNPLNAMRLASYLALELGRLDSANAPLYKDNAQRFAVLAQALDEELKQSLAPLKGKPYLVFHDAYQYAERRYGLTPLGSIAIDPERKPSVQTISKLRERLKASRAPCAFREPQFDGALVDKLVEGLQVRVGVLDPMGADLADGPGLYAQLLRRLAGNLRACLASS
jgi:zinc transport system substrate-binding protein